MEINNSSRQGIFFGLNSGIITTIGVLCGLVQTNINKHLIIISVVSLAISDGISEAYSIYLSKKAELVYDKSYAPVYSFITLLISKVVIVLSFLIPFIFSDSISYFKNMYWVIGWALVLTIFFDYKLSKMRNEKFINYFIPHIIVIIFVTVLTYVFGKYINSHS